MTRRHPISLTDRQLEAVNSALALWSADPGEGTHPNELRRTTEAWHKVQAEMKRRGLFNDQGKVIHTYPYYEERE